MLGVAEGGIHHRSGAAPSGEARLLGGDEVDALRLAPAGVLGPPLPAGRGPSPATRRQPAFPDTSAGRGRIGMA